MAKREEASKKQEALDDLDSVDPAPLTKHNVEFASPTRKKKMRKKLRKSKSSLGQATRNQFARSYVFDSKRDKDKASVKVKTFRASRSIRICYSIALFCFLFHLVWRDDNNKYHQAPWHAERKQNHVNHSRPHLSRQPTESRRNFALRMEPRKVEKVSRDARNADAR